MNEETMRLPGLERVKIVGGLHPKLMEIADPMPDRFLELLTKEDLAKMVDMSIKYQIKLAEVEMQGLKVQMEKLGEMQKLIRGFK
jgi:hypothetical protein